jgi:cytochrome c
MEFNKVFAAILVAAIVACLAGFISHKMVHPHQLEETAYHVAAMEGTAGGPAAAPAGPEPILALVTAADPAKGEQIARACAACHNFTKGGPDGTGPHLWNVMTRGVAATSFAYSDGMKSHAGRKWSYDELNHFLWKPKAFVEGTKMNFIGLKKPEDRAAVIAYLHTLNDAPPPLPSATDIAAEEAANAPPAEPAEGAAPTDGADEAAANPAAGETAPATEAPAHH